MPKHLSRLTAQDQVLTANDLFDPENRPHGKVMALAETKSLVDHSTQAHIFATKAELDAFVNEQKALALSERKVKVGDNLYISDTGVPDYWWTGVEGQWISELEVGRVDVNVETTVNSSSNPVSSSAVNTALGNYFKLDATKNLNAGKFGWALGGSAPNNVIAGGWGVRYSTENLNNYTTFEYDRIDVNRNSTHDYFMLTGDSENKVVRKKDLAGLGGGGFDPNTYEIALGESAGSDGGNAIAIGRCASSSCACVTAGDGGVAIGRGSSARSASVAVGGAICSSGVGSTSEARSVSIGAAAYSYEDAVAVGYYTTACSLGVAIGPRARAQGSAVAIGGSAGPSVGRFSVAIGSHAGDVHTCGACPSVIIGPYAEGGIDANGNTGHYPIVIGTSCHAIGDGLVNATIRVDAEGNLTVGGKPVGGGGDTAVEVWKGNVGFGEQDTFIGAKKTADGDGQFQNGYPRLHNHGQDIHEVSGFSRDSYENEDVWSHRFVIPWDLAMANDMSYMAANVKWQGNRNLLQPGDETTFVQPLMPANTGNTSSVFPYAIPAFEESPVYWTGTIIYNDTQEACGIYAGTAKMVSVPWVAMCSAETAHGGYNFLLARKSTQAVCSTMDGVTVALAYYGGGGGEVVLASQNYVRTLEQRIQSLEDKLAAVGA